MPAHFLCVFVCVCVGGGGNKNPLGISYMDWLMMDSFSPTFKQIVLRTSGHAR